MNVLDICSHHTIHIPQSCNLQEAARQMDRQHVGALLVTAAMAGSARVVGIVTDRDIVLKGVSRGLDPQTTTVAQVMTARIVSVDAQASVSDAMQTMLSQGVRRLAVDDGDGLVGVISMDDVIGALGSDWAMLAGIVRAGQSRERSGSVQSPLHL